MVLFCFQNKNCCSNSLITKLVGLNDIAIYYSAPVRLCEQSWFESCVFSDECNALVALFAKALFGFPNKWKSCFAECNREKEVHACLEQLLSLWITAIDDSMKVL